MFMTQSASKCLIVDSSVSEKSNCNHTVVSLAGDYENTTSC